MKICSECKVKKDISEFYKGRCYCKKCISMHNKLYYKANSDKVKQSTKEWATSNREKTNAYKKAWAIKNRESVLQGQKAYKENNKDKIVEYYLSNKASYIMRSRKREIAKINRTPKWLSEKEYSYIKTLYELSNRLSKCLGILHHVDHIIPLQGELVSGLHTPTNLQVIPSKLNLSKGNKCQIY